MLYFKKYKLLFIALIALNCLCSCHFLTFSPEPVPSAELVQKNTVTDYTPQRPPEIQVWLLADKLHTGMIFPYQWLLESGFIPPKNFPDAQFVTFSWGDEVAYVNQRWLRPSEIVNALFLPSPSVMECIPINWNVTEVSPNQHIWMKSIPRERGPYVAAFLNHFTVIGSDGYPITIGKSSWGNGVLLQSPHSYYFPRICNVWTGRALQACGGRINSLMSVHRDTVAFLAKRNGFVKIWDGSGNQKIKN